MHIFFILFTSSDQKFFLQFFTFLISIELSQKKVDIILRLVGISIQILFQGCLHTHYAFIVGWMKPNQILQHESKRILDFLISRIIWTKFQKSFSISFYFSRRNVEDTFWMIPIVVLNPLPLPLKNGSLDLQHRKRMS